MNGSPGGARSRLVVGTILQSVQIAAAIACVAVTVWMLNDEVWRLDDRIEAVGTLRWAIAVLVLGALAVALPGPARRLTTEGLAGVGGPAGWAFFASRVVGVLALAGVVLPVAVVPGLVATDDPDSFRLGAMLIAAAVLLVVAWMVHGVIELLGLFDPGPQSLRRAGQPSDRTKPTPWRSHGWRAVNVLMWWSLLVPAVMAGLQHYDVVQGARTSWFSASVHTVSLEQAGLVGTLSLIALLQVTWAFVMAGFDPTAASNRGTGKHLADRNSRASARWTPGLGAIVFFGTSAVIHGIVALADLTVASGDVSVYHVLVLIWAAAVLAAGLLHSL